MRLMTLLSLFIMCICTTTIAYEGKERLVWNKRPIKIVLNLNEEKLVHFTEKVNHWIPSGAEHLLEAQTVGDTVYLKARSEFPTMRLRVRERDTGTIYLLDVSAEESVDVPDTLYILKESKPQAESKLQGTQRKSGQQDVRVRLTRFASQELYAPERIRETDETISRAPLDGGIEIPLVRGGLVKAKTVASWKSGDWFVHAIKLKNTSSLTIQPDPRRDFRGGWSTATLQNLSLGAAGSDSDTTTLYLTSDRTFFESLNSGTEGL